MHTYRLMKRCAALDHNQTTLIKAKADVILYSGGETELTHRFKALDGVRERD